MGVRLAESTALRTVLDQFDQPAYLCTGIGEVRYANRVAREQAPCPPAWLLERVASGNGSSDRAASLPPAEGAPEPQLVDLESGLTLVVLPSRSRANATHGTHVDGARGPDNGNGGTDVLGSLPPRLGRVAELVSAGLTDQEIADHMGLTHKTVRTYVSRIYRRLGVSNRVMLTRLLVRV